VGGHQATDVPTATHADGWENIFQGQLTIGLDLEAMKQVFGSLPRCRVAMETGTHSPRVSRLLTALGHEVIVAHAQKGAFNHQEPAKR
jgi:transposase